MVVFSGEAFRVCMVVFSGEAFRVFIVVWSGEALARTLWLAAAVDSLAAATVLGDLVDCVDFEAGLEDLVFVIRDFFVTVIGFPPGFEVFLDAWVIAFGVPK